MKDDVINRQAAIDAIGKLSDEMYRTVEKGATFPTKAWFDGMAQAEHIVKNLPPAQPERLMNDLISRQSAIDTHCELCSDRGKCPDICPDVEVFRLIAPAATDLSAYSDKLWRTAYERGKKESRMRTVFIECGYNLTTKDRAAMESGIASKTGDDVRVVLLPYGAHVVDPQPNWIPLSERVPDESGYYLTSTEYGEVYCDYWDTVKFDQWFDEGHFDRLERIIAWMPLPEPYKKG